MTERLKDCVRSIFPTKIVFAWSPLQQVSGKWRAKQPRNNQKLIHGLLLLFFLSLISKV